MSNQLLIHPYGNEDDTYIEFEIPQNYFTYVKVGYGIADEAAGLTNGVHYLIEVRIKGEEVYHPLIDLLVYENTWQEQKASLFPFWGEDLEFRLIVDARGDYAYDWLQTTIELLPPPQPAWDLSDNLGEAQFTPDGNSIIKGKIGFFTPEGSSLIGLSAETVDGQSLPGQILLHPYSSETSSTLIFSVHNYNYKYLKTWFGLADGALPHSNGVEFTIRVSVDGGLSFFDLVQSTVNTDIWSTKLVELPQGDDLLLQLGASALGNIDYDWLQLRLDLIPIEDGEGYIISK